eukprot:IDg21753t1
MQVRSTTRRQYFLDTLPEPHLSSKSRNRAKMSHKSRLHGSEIKPCNSSVQFFHIATLVSGDLILDTWLKVRDYHGKL